MIPFSLADAGQAVANFLKGLPREVWYALAVLVLLLILRSHYIGVGIERCETRHKAAYDKAVAEAQKQEKRAPANAQAAQEAVKPKVTERVRVIREQIPVNSCPDYPDGVQAVIREAAAAAD
jgi:hypothetical protein